MSNKSILEKGYPDNLIRTVWPCYYLYDIDINGVMEVVNNLPVRERKILKYRYENKMLLKYIATIENVTSNRIKQIENKAVYTIRREANKFITKKPADIRDNMVTAENLTDGETFRYGGFDRNFDMTYEDLYRTGIISDTCPCCNEKFDAKAHPYMGIFKTDIDAVQFRIICKKCAYAISPRVIESDGKSHKGIGRKHPI